MDLQILQICCKITTTASWNFLAVRYSDEMRGNCSPPARCPWMLKTQKEGVSAGASLRDDRKGEENNGEKTK